MTGHISLGQIVARHGEITHVRVVKTALTLTLFHNSTELYSYRIAIGAGGYPDKVRAGDKRTPEGTFYICEKSVLVNDHYLGTRWMRISYPNIEDAERGFKQGLITSIQRDRIIEAIRQKQTPPQNTALGGGIGMHGGNGNNDDTQGDFWTFGCIGLTDQDVEELFNFVILKQTVVLIEH